MGPLTRCAGFRCRMARGAQVHTARRRCGARGAIDGYRRREVLTLTREYPADVLPPGRGIPHGSGTDGVPIRVFRVVP